MKNERKFRVLGHDRPLEMSLPPTFVVSTSAHPMLTAFLLRTSYALHFLVANSHEKSLLSGLRISVGGCIRRNATLYRRRHREFWKSGYSESGCDHGSVYVSLFASHLAQRNIRHTLAPNLPTRWLKWRNFQKNSNTGTENKPDFDRMF